jgi:hypothetical protein
MQIRFDVVEREGEQFVAAACLRQSEERPSATEIQRKVMGLEWFRDGSQTLKTRTDSVEKHINADHSGANA